ncbi:MULTISPECIES: hypothetical protein [Deinococcus]|uniref:Uncharacterized protein n=1 Tax=Deinococcus rufus TaxID=2136097 RepID=A0ABV7Z6Y9_9DEIO|nr:hypothetical protein [Deinococcus sp. AB2017081]WQE94413.1 hypothetical protein U2P90_13490 [Deinococcus sp. AB2017081]
MGIKAGYIIEDSESKYMEEKLQADLASRFSNFITSIRTWINERKVGDVPSITITALDVKNSASLKFGTGDNAVDVRIASLDPDALAKLIDKLE